MNNFENPPEAPKPESAQEKSIREQQEAEELGRKIRERRAQREGTESAQQKSERLNWEAEGLGRRIQERRSEKMQREKDRLKAKVESAKPPAEEISTERLLKEAGVKADWEAYKKAQDEALTAKISKFREWFGDASSEVSSKQKTRESKISSLAEVKKAGLGRIEKLADGMAYLAAADKLAMWGMKKGQDMAVKGGKSLAAAGLSPVAALERAGRRVAGTIQLEHALSERMKAEGMSSALRELPPEKRQDLHSNLLDLLSEKSRRASEKIVEGYKKIHKKGRILQLIEKLRGK